MLQLYLCFVIKNAEMAAPLKMSSNLSSKSTSFHRSQFIAFIYALSFAIKHDNIGRHFAADPVKHTKSL